jgi:hypothetical protein
MRLNRWTLGALAIGVGALVALTYLKVEGAGVAAVGVLTALVTATLPALRGKS